MTRAEAVGIIDAYYTTAYANRDAKTQALIALAEGCQKTEGRADQASFDLMKRLEPSAQIVEEF